MQMLFISFVAKKNSVWTTIVVSLIFVTECLIIKILYKIQLLEVLEVTGYCISSVNRGFAGCQLQFEWVHISLIILGYLRFSHHL